MTTQRALTVTFGDRAENEAGMQMVGTRADSGVQPDQLRACKERLEGEGIACELKDLGALLKDTAERVHERVHDEALVLVIRRGVDALLGDSEGEAKAREELLSMPKDSTSLMYGQVRNKHARHNNTMADPPLAPQEPDITNGKGTVVSFEDYPVMDRLRREVGALVTAPTPLVGELNDYFDARTCGIGFHGDAERKITVGARFGSGANGVPLKFTWYKHGRPIGYEGRIELNQGDVYIMSEKAVGSDFKRRSILTLRHAAGKDTCKYARVKRKAGEASAQVLLL